MALWDLVQQNAILFEQNCYIITLIMINRNIVHFYGRKRK